MGEKWISYDHLNGFQFRLDSNTIKVIHFQNELLQSKWLSLDSNSIMVIAIDNVQM